MDTKTDKVRENFNRRAARRQGLILRKSRAKKWNVNNYQGYMIIDFNNNIQAGERFDLTIEDVEKFLVIHEKQLPRRK